LKKKQQKTLRQQTLSRKNEKCRWPSRQTAVGFNCHIGMLLLLIYLLTYMY